jgi:hypothetical protein
VLSGDPGSLNSTPSTGPADTPALVAMAPWESWPVYAIGAGVLGVIILALVIFRRRAAAESLHPDP